MQPHLTIVPPCAELAKHVLYYTLRSDVSTAVDTEHTAMFPSNLYGWLVITHRGSIRGMRSGTRLPPIALTGIQTRRTRTLRRRRRIDDGDLQARQAARILRAAAE